MFSFFLTKFDFVPAFILFLIFFKNHNEEARCTNYAHMEGQLHVGLVLAHVYLVRLFEPLIDLHYICEDN